MNSNFINKMLSCSFKNGYLLNAELAYMAASNVEMGFMGAGIGGGFINTQELHVMKYNEAMKGPDKDKWQKAVKEEYKRMEKNKVW
jgi:hypothetical protein